MGDNEILKRSWCDKVFDHRNKSYGAYKLRQQTGSRYTKALVCVFVLIVLCVVPIVILTAIFSQPVELKHIVDDIQRIDGVRIQEAEPVTKPKKAAEPEPSEENVEVTDIDPIEEMLAVEQKEEEEIEVVKPEDLLKDSLEALKEKLLDKPVSEERTDGVMVDSIPRYPGGIASFMKWLDSTMVYPPACIRQKMEGTVEVAFIVEPDGSISDLRVVKGTHAQLNNEALRTLHKMKQWRPATRNGQPIKAQVTIPIVFELSQ